MAISNLVGAGIVAGIIALGGGGLIYSKYYYEDEADEPIMKVDNSIPDDFFRKEEGRSESKTVTRAIKKSQSTPIISVPIKEVIIKKDNKKIAPKPESKLKPKLKKRIVFKKGKKSIFKKDSQSEADKINKLRLNATLNSSEVGLLNQNISDVTLEYEKDKIEVFKKDKNFGKDVKEDFASNRVDLNRVIVADTMISAILITGINSHLAGKVVAQIEDDIFGYHGFDKLIPKGSKAIGAYIPLEGVSQERLSIQWFRIITPEGININLSEAYSADMAGRSGAIGEYDSRWMERYGQAIFLSTVTNSLSFGLATVLGNTTTTSNTSTDTTTSETTTLKNDILRDYKSDIQSVSAKILDEQLSIKPTIDIPAGERIFISPSADIRFSEREFKIINTRIIR